MNADTRYGKSAYGRSRWNTIVSGAVLSTWPRESTPEKAESAADPIFGSSMRSNEVTMSSFVNGLPSCHLTPWRIVNVHVSGVEPASHFVASFGMSLYCGSGKTR